MNGGLELNDGRLLSWGNDGTVRIWCDQGTPLAVLEGRTFEGGKLPVTGALELADGRLLSWSIDGKLQLWQGNGAPLALMEGHKNPVRGALELADGRLLSWSDGRDLEMGFFGHVLTDGSSSPTDRSSTLENFIRSQASTEDSSLRLWSKDGTALGVLKRHLIPQCWAASNWPAVAFFPGLPTANCVCGPGTVPSFLY